VRNVRPVIAAGALMAAMLAAACHSSPLATGRDAGGGGSGGAGGAAGGGAGGGNMSVSDASSDGTDGTDGSSDADDGALTDGGSDGDGPDSRTGQVDIGDSVLMHHRNPNRDGVYVQPALTKAAAAGLTKDPSFAPTFIGQVYAQPLFVDGMGRGPDLVIVATESNDVFAFDAATGAQAWTTNLGPPVRRAALPCGNIDTYGVTGTPVIDLASRTLFVASESTPDDGTTKQHQVFALSIDDGKPRAGWPVDMAATAVSAGLEFYATPQGQRAALALVGGTLFIPFGGLAGDCGPYHGWVVAIDASDPTRVHAWATPAGKGGIWGMSGIASDGANIYVTTGNTGGTDGLWGGGESILSFPAIATLAAAPSSWTPMNWYTLDTGDVDLGGVGPVVFDIDGSTPSHVVAALGKDGNAYLEDAANLTGMGDPMATIQAAPGPIIGAMAVYTTATATYVAFRGTGAACTSGAGGDLVTLQVIPGAPPTFAGSWCATADSNGSPMVTTTDGHADAIVWTTGAEGSRMLMGFDGDTGAVIFDGGGVIIPTARRFNAAIAAKGRIFVAGDNMVVAVKP
jgi:hypothetical protein